MIIVRIIMIIAAVALGWAIFACLLAKADPGREFKEWFVLVTGLCTITVIIGIVVGLIALIVKYV